MYKFFGRWSGKMKMEGRGVKYQVGSSEVRGWRGVFCNYSRV